MQRYDSRLIIGGLLVLVSDALKGRVRHGKIWRVPGTGTAWFAGNAALAAGRPPLLERVMAALPDDQWVVADHLRWDGRVWSLEGRVVRHRLDGDGDFSPPAHAARLPCEGLLAIPWNPDQLARELLPAHTASGDMLLARGGQRNLAIVVRRYAWMLVPLLALLAALPVFVRFANRDRILPACLRAALAAAVPVALVATAGALASVLDASPLAVVGSALAATFGACWALWLRWRL